MKDKPKDKPKDKSGASKPKPKASAGLGISFSFWPVWLGLTLLVAIGFACASKWARFPFDTEIARWLQKVDGTDHAWAKVLTEGAKEPWVYGWLVATALLGWRLVSWRMALVVPAAYGAVLALDHYLKPLIARPRPGTFGLKVIGKLTGFGCPSTFGLVMSVTVGTLFWMYVQHARGRARWIGASVTLAVLLAGAAGRVVLGAHWPSDLLLSYAAGALVVAGLMKVIVR